MRRGLVTLLPLLALLVARMPLLAGEDRTSNIDVILLVDKSLSMVDAEDAVKKYAAGKIIGPVLMPGDRLIIETFYGKIDRLYSGTIRSEEDKPAIVRSLNGILPDGRFTDIGAALDRAKADLEELGAPERPKYVLLLTDERQEAPAGTKYYAPDYRLSHPALQFINRVDLGAFRAITVGFDVGSRVDSSAPKVMRLLAEPPARKSEDFPDLAPGEDAVQRDAKSANAPAAGAPGLPAKKGGAAGNATEGPGQGGAKSKDAAVPVVVGVAVLVFLAVAVIAVLHSKSKKKRSQRQDDPERDGGVPQGQ
jgi:hypothetical protein